MKYVFDKLKYTERDVRGLNKSFGQYRSMARHCDAYWEIQWQAQQDIARHYLQCISEMYKGMILYDEQ